MSLHRRPAPLLLRAFNAVARAFPLTRIRFDPDAIRRWAERFTDVRDYGDPGFLRRLEALLESDRASAELTPSGSIAKRIFYQWHVTNRLKEVDLLRRHPEIRDIPVPAPVVIMGGYRTGTTHLHTLLTQDPGFRAPRAWEVSFPISTLPDPEKARARRRRNTRAVIGLSEFIMPDQREVHAVSLDGPEECHFLLENAALSMTQYICFQGYDYAHWLLGEDVRDAYESMRAQYQILSWQDQQGNPGSTPRRWLLKCPLHTWYLEDLMAVFPDARLLWTHRPMRSTVPSTCGLSAVTASKFFDRLDGPTLGNFWVDYYEKGFARGLAARDAHPEWSVLDVRLKDVASDPQAQLARIYSHLGVEFSREAERRIDTYLEEQKRVADAPGKHRYTPAEFGFSAEELDERFVDYHRRFEV